MEHPGGKNAGPAAEEHVSKLADSGIGQHALQVVLAKRELRGLPDRAQEQQQADCGEHALTLASRKRPDALEDLVKVNRTQRPENERHAQGKTNVADPGDDERLLARVGSRLPGEVEAD